MARPRALRLPSANRLPGLNATPQPYKFQAAETQTPGRDSYPPCLYTLLTDPTRFFIPDKKYDRTGKMTPLIPYLTP